MDCSGFTFDDAPINLQVHWFKTWETNRCVLSGTSVLFLEYPLLCMMNERQASKPLGTGIWGLHDSKPLQSSGMADGRQRLGYGTFVQTMKPVNDRTK